MNVINTKHNKLKELLKTRMDEMKTIKRLMTTIEVIKLIDTEHLSIKENQLNVFIPLLKIDLKSMIDLLKTLDFVKGGKFKVKMFVRTTPIHFDGVYVNKQMIETESDYGYIDYEDSNEKYRDVYMNTNNNTQTSDTTNDKRNVLNPFVDVNPNLIVMSGRQVADCSQSGRDDVVSQDEMETLDLYSKLYVSDLIDAKLITHDKEKNVMVMTTEPDAGVPATRCPIEIDVDETNNYFWSYTYMTECVVLRID